MKLARLLSPWPHIRSTAVSIRRWLPWSRPRNLRREVQAQKTKGYWRRRERVRHRRFQIVKNRHRLWSIKASARENSGIFLTTVRSLARASVLGGLIAASILAVEWLLVHEAGLGLISSSEPKPPISAFPQLAVTVLAALLGFYLATVGIVLGNAYEEVSARVRSLILDSDRTRIYLATIGLSIGAGLLLVLLEGLGVLSYGYLTLSAYALLVCLAAWAFWSLAYGAFNLMNPVALADEPLRNLGLAIEHLDSEGYLTDEAVLRAVASSADSSLRVLAELIELTRKRHSVDRSDLALMVAILCLATEAYAGRKHKLVPDSRWFLRESSYPRWIEAGFSERSIALQTASPLQVRYEPVVDWLERRAARLIVSTLNACIATNDRDAAMRILASSGRTARTLASVGRIDDAQVFVNIVRDGCWNLQSENETANAIAGQPPVLLVSLLLGWNSAVEAWPKEIARVVDETRWDNRNTRAVEIRGSSRVWNAAQRALRDVRAELDIEGHRVTPDWYLRSTLAWEGVLSLQEFADQMPNLIREYVSPEAAERMSPEARSLARLQSFQLLERAALSAEVVAQSVGELKALHQGREPIPTSETDSLDQKVDELRPVVLNQIADALVGLTPVHENAEPDYFGQSLSTLVDQTEKAISGGNVDIVRSIFRQLLRGTLAYHEHVVNVYKPPTYQFTPANLNPMLDLFELSGLALVYATLRDDASAEPILETWREWLEADDDSRERASALLRIVEVAAMDLFVSPTRTEWQGKLARNVRDSGLGIPTFPFDDTNQQRLDSAPRLIRMMGVLDDSAFLSVDAYELFAGEIIAPATKLPSDELRERRALRRYFEQLDLLERQDGDNRSDSHAELSEEEAEDE